MAVLISWYKQNNDDPWEHWNVNDGEPVDAGTTSRNSVFLIWNNRGDKEKDATDAETCTLTTKDMAGGGSGELVTQKWIWARVDTMGGSGSVFSEIGDTVTVPVKAGGDAPAGTIKGTKNDGTKENSARNFAQVTLHAKPLITATAGNVNFLLRLQYTLR